MYFFHNIFTMVINSYILIMEHMFVFVKGVEGNPEKRIIKQG